MYPKGRARERLNTDAVKFGTHTAYIFCIQEAHRLCQICSIHCCWDWPLHFAWAAVTRWGENVHCLQKTTSSGHDVMKSFNHGRRRIIKHIVYILSVSERLHYVHSDLTTMRHPMLYTVSKYLLWDVWVSNCFEPTKAEGSFSLLPFLLAPWMPCTKPYFAFLDVASINQADEELKERGIYGIGGFLKASKELRILWSRPYLSRLLARFGAWWQVGAEYLISMQHVDIQSWCAMNHIQSPSHDPQVKRFLEAVVHLRNCCIS